MRIIGGTNRAGYEVYALLGEAYGSGLPIGYVFLKATGEPAPHSKQSVLETFLRHFRDEKKIKAIVTLSDMDWSETNASRAVFPEAKHQLCLWHCIKAVKTRLAILRRQPAHYSWEEAVKEFEFIDRKFLPLAQQPVPKRPFARITIRHGLTPSSTPAHEPDGDHGCPAPTPIPENGAASQPSKVHHMVLRIRGKTVSLAQQPPPRKLVESLSLDDGTDAESDDNTESDGGDGDGDDGDGDGAGDNSDGDGNGGEQGSGSELPVLEDENQGDRSGY